MSMLAYKGLAMVALFVRESAIGGSGMISFVAVELRAVVNCSGSVEQGVAVEASTLALTCIEVSFIAYRCIDFPSSLLCIFAGAVTVFVACVVVALVALAAHSAGLSLVGLLWGSLYCMRAVGRVAAWAAVCAVLIAPVAIAAGRCSFYCTCCNRCGAMQF